MAEYWRANPISVDLITSVPLHPARQRERGYNQADLLAQALGRVIGIPVGTAWLKRVRHTRSQVSLNAADRRENVHNAFACEVPVGGEVPAPSSKGKGCADPGVSGRRVLVIDDVCTTGSTLEACSVALKAAGASSVWGFTLARAASLGVSDQRSEGSRIKDSERSSLDHCS
jgi:ComF family protein